MLIIKINLASHWNNNAWLRSFRIFSLCLNVYCHWQLCNLYQILNKNNADRSFTCLLYSGSCLIWVTPCTLWNNLLEFPLGWRNWRKYYHMVGLFTQYVKSIFSIVREEIFHLFLAKGNMLLVFSFNQNLQNRLFPYSFSQYIAQCFVQLNNIVHVILSFKKWRFSNLVFLYFVCQFLYSVGRIIFEGFFLELYLSNDRHSVFKKNIL